jgi:hypothetical protein
VRITPAPGDTVVKWGGSWWRAEVLQTDGDKSFIRYVGYGAEHDEWITPDRIKTFSEEDARQPLPQNEPVEALPARQLVQGSPARGDLLVHWGQQWWPAEILQSEGEKHFIRYKGYDAHWDEWVTIDRMGLYEGD